MGILKKEAIMKAIEEKKIVIRPFDPTQVGPASIDLHLSHRFLIFKSIRQFLKITDETNPEALTEEIIIPSGNYFLLLPNEMVIGFTKEKITLSEDLCGWIVGRGRFSKLGLLVEVSSGFVMPGLKEKELFLQISNINKNPVALYPETKICQIVIQEVKKEEK
jgi:dCTP deaminase